MSKIYVDEIAGIASPSTVAIPGHVIQVVQGAYTNMQNSTSSTSLVDTGLYASITPSSTSSKILITVSTQTTGDGNYVGFGIDRNGTLLASQPFGFTGAGTTWSDKNITYLDEPASTDTLTYTLQFRSYSGGTVYHGWGTGVGSIQSIVLMEIAG